MNQETLYRWVKINDEKDLPKKAGIYFCLATMVHKDGTIAGFEQISHFYPETKHWSANSKQINVTHWLEPVSHPVAVPDRIFYIDEVRKWIKQLDNEEISMSKFVELLNDKATRISAIERFKVSKEAHPVAVDSGDKDARIFELETALKILRANFIKEDSKGEQQSGGRTKKINP